MNGFLKLRPPKIGREYSREQSRVNGFSKNLEKLIHFQELPAIPRLSTAPIGL